jgi:hypothetical protein
MHEIGVIQREMNVGRLAVVRDALDAEVVNERVMGEPADGRLSSDGRAVLSARIKLERTTVERTTVSQKGIRTRDPHLGKVVDLVRRLGSPPLSGLFSAGSSAQSAESAPLRWPTLNALNLYQLVLVPPLAEASACGPLLGRHRSQLPLERVNMC